MYSFAIPLRQNHSETLIVVAHAEAAFTRFSGLDNCFHSHTKRAATWLGSWLGSCAEKPWANSHATVSFVRSHCASGCANGLVGWTLIIVFCILIVEFPHA